MSKRDHYETMRMSKGLPPVTITITEPRDAIYVAEGILLKMTGGDRDAVQKILNLIGLPITEARVEAAVEYVLALTIKTRKCNPPMCVKPLLIHILRHMNPDAKP